MEQNARKAALTALLQTEDNEGYSNLVLDKALRAAALDGRDAALAATIFYGVLEKRITLDWYIAQCLTDPRKKLDATARMALRCGAYQLLYLDRVPDPAAVNETVELLRGTDKEKYRGFVNGVLRALARKKSALALPAGDSPRALSLRYSVPEKLIQLWQRGYGKEITLRLLESFGERAETYLRVNTLKTTPQELAAAMQEHGGALELMDGLPACGKLDARGSPASLPEFEEGLFHVQDLSAQLVCAILAPQPGETVLDCCAAPGGKSFTMAQQMGDRGKIIAVDLYKGRVKLIQSGAARLGISSIEARQGDAAQPMGDLPPVDRVLCDVPCSGFGVIRRKPEIRYKKFEEIERLPAVQYQILQNVAKALRPGGTVVYATCTLNPAENGGVAERFLEENRAFVPLPIELPGIRRQLDEPAHHLTMMPFAGASDGFFAAAFQKRE